MAEQNVDPVEGQDNPERPEWLPANFNSPEDLARSYTEAQRKITELSTQNKGLEESIGELSQQFEQFAAQQNQPVYDPNADPYVAAFEQAMEQGDYRAAQAIQDQRAAAIAQQTAQQILQQTQTQQPSGLDPQVVAFMADQNLTARYGEEWSAYKEKVGEAIQNDPLFKNDALWQNPDLATNALNRAFEMVKAQDVLSGNTAVQQQLADTRAMKLAAQSAVGASSRPSPVEAAQAEWEAIKNAVPSTYYG